LAIIGASCDDLVVVAPSQSIYLLALRVVGPREDNAWLNTSASTGGGVVVVAFGLANLVDQDLGTT